MLDLILLKSSIFFYKEVGYHRNTKKKTGENNVCQCVQLKE